MESIIALGLIAICVSSLLGPRLNVAAPLLLVAVGIIVGFIPGIPMIYIEPEWILAGVLPPLLYSAAASMPVMEFRREFAPIAGLSILLVIFSSVLLGVVMYALIPDLSLPWSIALGAVLSPTDAVAVSIAKGAGVSPRITAILEGEGLLNDATALVMLRTAIAATAASVSLWEVAGSVAYSVLVAAVIGLIVGKLNLWIRGRFSSPTATTALSFAVPFVAMVPAEALEASGLVAAVVAGLITGQGAAKHFSPIQRISDSQNWATVEFVLEGAIFLTMGLQFHTLIEDLPDHSGAVLLSAGGIALVALVGSIVVRALFVAPLLEWLHRRSVRRQGLKPKLERVQAVLSLDDLDDVIEQMRKTGEVPESITDEKTRAAIQERYDRLEEYRASKRRAAEGHLGLPTGHDGALTAAGGSAAGHDDGLRGSIGGPREEKREAHEVRKREERAAHEIARRKEREMKRLQRRRRHWFGRIPDREETLTRLRRSLADIDYFLASPLTWRDGTVVVWAGMRGAITVAAAQTLPLDAPQRSFLILVAFLVAGFSLLIQGGTLRGFVALVKPTPAPSQEAQDEERRALNDMLDEAAAEFASVLDEDEIGTLGAKLGSVEAKRTALLNARDDGIFDAALLSHALDVLDAEQIALELRGFGHVS
ncbi:MAG: cation:proton antiporter [Ancrocorticia sp.]